MYLSGINFMTYFPGGHTVTLVGRFMYSEAANIHEVFGDLFISNDPVFSAYGAFINYDLDKTIAEGAGEGKAYASDLLVYNPDSMS